MSLRLHGPAHDAKGHERLTVKAGRECGNNGMGRTFAGTDFVRMAGLQIEAMPAVLQTNPCAWHHDTGTEAHVVGVDEGNHHAGGIRGSEVNRTTGTGRAMAVVARHTAINKP